MPPATVAPPPAASQAQEEAGGVLCLGDLLLDVLMAGSGHDSATLAVQAGGSAANTAAWLAWCGVPAAFVGAVGDDAAGELLGLDLRRQGVRLALQVVPGARSGSFLARVAEGTYSPLATHRGANDLLHWGDGEDRLLHGVRHLHISGYLFAHALSCAAAVAAAAAARARGISISLDLGASHTLRVLPAPDLERALAALAPDVLFCNEDEAATLLSLLGGPADPAGPAEHGLPLSFLLRWAPLAVLKRGRHGSSAASRTWPGPPLEQPAPPVVVADAVGAGDAFVAGFLVAWLSRSGPLDHWALAGQAMARATEAAAACLQRVGGRP